MVLVSRKEPSSSKIPIEMVRSRSVPLTQPTLARKSGSSLRKMMRCGSVPTIISVARTAGRPWPKVPAVSPAGVL